VDDRSVLVPDRHAAEEDEPVRGRQHLRDPLAVHRPRHLRAAVQPFGAEQQHDRLQVHADVGPLRRAHVAVDVAEQAGGRAEEGPVRGRRPLPRLQVPARDAERAVPLRAEGGLALAVGGLQLGRIQHGGKNTPGNDLPLDLGEPDLDLVQPRRIGGGKVNVDLGITRRELVDSFAFCESRDCRR
jgi:hypothetical protein